MTWRQGSGGARLSYAERRSVRRAISKGDPIDDLRLRRYAVQLIRTYKRKCERYQRKVADYRSNKRYWALPPVLIGIGLVFLLTGAQSALKIVASAVIFGNACLVIVNLVRPNRTRYSQRALDRLACLEQVYLRDSEPNQP